jgi:dolichol-phosphate mannosyltransferase
MQIGMVIPTYNEAHNLSRLVAALCALPLDLCLLVVDDNSPDGTGQLAEDLSTANPRRMVVIHRSQKSGLASAYIQGFRYFLKNRVNTIGQIDADLSHDPAALVAMSKRLETCDVVFGSRYISGGSVDMQWPLWRQGLSAWGNFYARAILRVPVRDLTTGYRLWRADTLRGLPFDNIQSKGYVFQVEMAYLAHCLEYRIREIPIHFEDRCRGRSKMSLQIQVEAALRVWQIWLTHRHLCHIGKAARNQQSGVVT